MNICGFQKLTLLDYPGHLACTIFTGGCNFRCPFCHNASLVLHPDSNSGYTKDEILTALKKRTGILEGVCISGGEPTLQPDLYEFIQKIKALGFLVKLDTNGTNPALVKRLCADGLVNYIAMDIKNSKEHYAQTIGVPEYDLSLIEESTDFLLHTDIPYEFRTTVVRELHMADDFRSIGTWLKNARQFYLQSFVDSGDIIQSGLTACTKEELNAYLEILQKDIPNALIRGIE